ncbi:hypothetical protein R5R35_009024 [Gryllus longicercus]|uniref:Peroxisomal membrane protein PEX14 n=1 Tax=Gryllus longicercus TaxID=2509291 RepID=A0AAN9VU81_9ORTH
MAENNAEKRVQETVLRQDVINTAVNFLQNPTVQRSSLKHRQAFLKSKGLSDEEIRVACERATALLAEKQNFTPPGVLTNIPNAAVPIYTPQAQSSWSKFRDFANAIVLIGGVSYGIYLFYKKYIVPWLVGGKGQKPSLEQSISQLDLAIAASIQELRDSVNKVHADLKTLHERQTRSPSDGPATIRQIEELKNEIASVKGLLLNRSQFAPPVTKSPLTPPSIPAWQLSAAESAKETEESQGGKGDADIEDICLSGSGSSETEMVTNNGSDSSLEMIRE